MRCFIGVPVTGELASTSAVLANGLPAATPVRNLHMTLAFLGNCRPEQLELLNSELAQLAQQSSPFAMYFTQCEPFPASEGPFLALTGEPSAALSHLHQQLNERLAGLGFERESSRFRPHITLAKPGHAQPTKTGEWLLAVDTLWLYESQLDANGRPTYTSLSLFPFSCP